MKIYFIRHGETDYNKRGLIQGRIDIPLNEDGLAQAEEAAAYFRDQGIVFDKVYASPLIRAHKTAAIVSGWEMERIQTDLRIQELAFGAAEGMDFYTLPEGIMNLFRKPEDYEVPEGAESIAQLQERCQDFLDDLAKLQEKEPDVQNVLVATHGAMLRGLLSCIEKTPVPEFWKKGFRNCTFVRVRLQDGNYILEEVVNPVRDARELKIPGK